MNMQRSLAALAMAAGLAVATLLPLAARADVSASGSISASDLLAQDEYGSFYYDLYTLTNTSAADTVITLTLSSAGSLQGWLGYWSVTVLPSAVWSDGATVNLYAQAEDYDFQSSAGSSLTLASYTLAAGATLQIAVSSAQYLADGGASTLGGYTLQVASGSSALALAAAPVPEPGTLLMASVGAAWLLRRRRSA